MKRTHPDKLTLDTVHLFFGYPLDPLHTLFINLPEPTFLTLSFVDKATNQTIKYLRTTLNIEPCGYSFYVAKYGSFNLFKWFQQIYPKRLLWNAIDVCRAAGYNRLELVHKTADLANMDIDSPACILVLINGIMPNENIPLIEFMLAFIDKTTYSIRLNHVPGLLEGASRTNNLNVVKLVYEKIAKYIEFILKTKKWILQGVVSATTNLNIVKFIKNEIDYNPEKFVGSENGRILAYAISVGNSEIIRWLRGSGLQFSMESLVSCIEHDNLESLRLGLADMTPDFAPLEELLNRAVRLGSSACLKWLLENIQLFGSKDNLNISKLSENALEHIISLEILSSFGLFLYNKEQVDKHRIYHAHDQLQAPAVLHWLIEKHYFTIDLWFIKKLIKYDHVPLLEYTMQKHPEMYTEMYTSHIMELVEYAYDRIMYTLNVVFFTLLKKHMPALYFNVVVCLHEQHVKEGKCTSLETMFAKMNT